MIVYYSDSEETEGGTRVVPRKGEDDPLYEMPYDKISGLGEFAWINDKTNCEKYFEEKHPEVYEFRKKLYEREVGVNFKPGTVLFYRHDVWFVFFGAQFFDRHRGYPIKSGATRYVQNVAFKKAGCDWITIWNKVHFNNFLNLGMGSNTLLDIR
jgi:hypothetical protein